LTEVISVRFKNKGKVYYFDPAGTMAEKGEYVIVETSKGLEFAECVMGNHGVEDSSLIPPLRPVIRAASPEDISRAELNRKKEAEAFEICREKIEKHELDMKLVDVEYNFEGNKILFFFTSDGRVDFRELVKELASIFKTRIELRQIGVRDEARMLGGLGICGKTFCCSQFLDDFQPVSIKMAKTQGLSLNPTKISGTCGRLMCCLKYEQDAYEDLVKNVPKVDAFVETPLGKGTVIDVNLLRGEVRVRLDEQADNSLKTFAAEDLEILGGKAKRAEFLAARAEGKLEDARTTRQQAQRPAFKATPKIEPEISAKSPSANKYSAVMQDSAGGNAPEVKSGDKPDTKAEQRPHTHHRRGGKLMPQENGAPPKSDRSTGDLGPKFRPGIKNENPLQQTDGKPSGDGRVKKNRSRHRRYGGPKAPDSGQNGGAPSKPQS